MLARKHREAAGAVQQTRRISPLRALRQTLRAMIFEYEDARRIRMARDAHAREQGYKEAEAKYQEQILRGQEQLAAKDEQIRQLEEEKRRLRDR